MIISACMTEYNFIYSVVHETQDLDEVLIEGQQKKMNHKQKRIDE